MAQQTIKFKFLEQFADDLVKEIKKLLVKKDKVASKKLFKSIDYQIDTKGEILKIQLLGEEYFTYVNEGRKPGKWPNIDAIKKWIRVKPIRSNLKDDQLAFLIARSIKENGIKPANILDEAVDNILKKKKLNKALYKTFDAEISDMIKRLNR